MIDIIDTHMHLFEKFADYEKAIQNTPIKSAIYVNVDSKKTDQEMYQAAHSILQLCETNHTLQGAIISGNMELPSFQDSIASYAANPYVKGIRQILLHEESSTCLQSIFIENVKFLGQLHLIYEIILNVEQINDGIKLATQCPETQFVIDHCGFISPLCQDEAMWGLWRVGMSQYAALPNVTCKISGLIELCEKQGWETKDLAGIINFCIERFGEDRIVFGSNWPVCEIGSSLKDWLNVLNEIIVDRSDQFKQKFFHDNAARLYRINE